MRKLQNLTLSCFCMLFFLLTDGQAAINGGGGNIVFEKDQYFYHANQVGSTAYVTDSDGELFEHLEYFPFGETWIEESTNNDRVRYLFTSKELDEETGLYYFGARYYDPRTSVWASADPILGEYLSGKPNGGVYNSFTLGLYGYSRQNPVLYQDPNGEWFLQAIGVAVTVYDAYQNYQEGGMDAVVEGIVQDAAMNLVTGGLGKLAVKGVKVAAKTGVGQKVVAAASKKANDLVETAIKKGGCSFAPETLVATPEGYKAIDDLKPGDEVMARDEKTGKVIAKRILSHFATLHEDDVRALTIKNSSGEEQLIITSDEHPFYVQDQGWFNASKLSAGDMLKTLNGGAVTLLANSHMNGTETLHNLEVEEFHTFGIEGNGIWVHNACDIRVTKGGGNLVDLASPARRRHILDGDKTGGGHRPGTGKPGKSEFPAGRSDDSIMHDISDIATDPTLTSRAGRGGRTITDGTRNGVNIRVVQERNGDIVTGFPTNTPRNPKN